MIRLKDNSPVPGSSDSDDKKSSHPFECLKNESFSTLKNDGIVTFPYFKQDLDVINANAPLFTGTSSDDTFVGDYLGVINVKLKEKVNQKETYQSAFITSRFCTDTNDYFLYYMLERVFNFPIIEQLTTQERADTYFSLLICSFPRLFKQALVKGLFRQYRTFAHNDSNVRGTIDINRQIKTNVPFLGKIAYRTREYTDDNWLIYLICATIQAVKASPFRTMLTKDPELNLLANHILQIGHHFTRYTTWQIINQNERHPIHHAYYLEYQPLQRLCLAILKHQATKYSNAVEETNGILFNASWLFEEYVNKLLAPSFDHPDNRHQTKAQKLFANNNDYLFYPDFIGKDQLQVVADTKYKDFSKNNVHVHDDLLQILAYMYRLAFNAGVLIYPDTLNPGTGKPDHQKLELIHSPAANIYRYSIGVCIQAPDYHTFKQIIHQREKELIRFITEL
ncbi:McrC family protein [Secundilactobacillus folii]|nr:hypothetical protein [Secundilactobacillus folii]